MNEVKRYDVDWSYQDAQELKKYEDGQYVLFDDFESERTLRIEAEKKLHELQDAIDQIYNLDTNKPSEENRKMRFLVEANIRESRKRREV